MARASSGSRSSINSIEPLMSAKSTVTVLRSPSAFSNAVVSAIRIGSSVDFLTDVGPDAAIAAPHFLQNRAPGLNSALHTGQTSSSFDPHCSQKAASGGLSVLQEGHCMGLVAQLVELRLSVLQIRCFEALGEPIVDLSEHLGAPHRGCRSSSRSMLIGVLFRFPASADIPGLTLASPHHRK